MSSPEIVGSENLTFSAVVHGSARRGNENTLRDVRTRAGAYIAFSQLCLLSFVALCIALHPGLVLKWNEGGLSNYGIHVKTVVPYTLGFALCSFFAFATARTLATRSHLAKQMRLLLNVYGSLVLFSMLSTYGYTLNTPLKLLHVVSGIAIILFGTGASLWMFARLRSSRSDAAWLALQLTGFVLALIDFFNVLHVLFLAQLLTGVGFGFLVVHAVRRSGANFHAPR